jgi:hypothetical protein
MVGPCAARGDAGLSSMTGRAPPSKIQGAIYATDVL